MITITDRRDDGQLDDGQLSLPRLGRGTSRYVEPLIAYRVEGPVVLDEARNQRLASADECAPLIVEHEVVEAADTDDDQVRALWHPLALARVVGFRQVLVGAKRDRSGAAWIARGIGAPREGLARELVLEVDDLGARVDHVARALNAAGHAHHHNGSRAGAVRGVAPGVQPRRVDGVAPLRKTKVERGRDDHLLRVAKRESR